MNPPQITKVTKSFEVVISAEYQSYKFGTQNTFEHADLISPITEEEKIKLAWQTVADTFNDIHNQARENTHLAQVIAIRNMNFDKLLEKYKLDPTLLPPQSPFYI